MLCVALIGPLEQIPQQILQALPFADLVELRLDLFDAWNLEALSGLRRQFSIPMIFTLRGKIQGGNYPHTEERRLADLKALATLEPEYLDIESHVPPSFVAEIQAQHPKISIILSYHNFEETPDDLDSLYTCMHMIPAPFYKITVKAKNTLDTLRFLLWVKNKSQKIIATSMGEEGQISRILAPLVGSPINYASLEEGLHSAPGQLPLKMLAEGYRYHFLNAETAVYGLIGDPITQSISEHTHNHFFATKGLNAVYVKMLAEAAHLEEFLKLAKELPFRGLSVTMPHKETIMSFLDQLDSEAQEIGAVNTLVLRGGKWIGYNTDAKGALIAIETLQSVKGKRIVLLGAGGAAKAIAYEAHKRGALVTVVNRTKARALETVTPFGGVGLGLDEMGCCAEKGYDILINSVPTEMPIHQEDILPHAVVMDIKIRPKMTSLLKAAEEKGCSVIPGFHMFIEQAFGQYDLWFGSSIDESLDTKKGLLTFAEKILTERRNIF